MLRTPSEVKEAGLTPDEKTLMLKNAAVIDHLADLGKLERVRAQIALAHLRLEAERAGVPADVATEGIDLSAITGPYEPGEAELALARAMSTVVKAPIDVLQSPATTEVSRTPTAASM